MTLPYKSLKMCSVADTAYPKNHADAGQIWLAKKCQHQ
jgi:hypothetical protein